jgi:hypothetical protein
MGVRQGMTHIAARLLLVLGDPLVGISSPGEARTSR